jgi:hypothetical protein
MLIVTTDWPTYAAVRPCGVLRTALKRLRIYNNYNQDRCQLPDKTYRYLVRVCTVTTIKLIGFEATRMDGCTLSIESNIGRLFAASSLYLNTSFSMM